MSGRKTVSDADGIAWFERTFGVPIGDKPGTQDVERVKRSAGIQPPPAKCKACDGKGWFLDTTYDRTGAEVQCERCYGTGKSQAEIRAILARPTPKE